jgi:hypothetical protein
MFSAVLNVKEAHQTISSLASLFHRISLPFELCFRLEVRTDKNSKGSDATRITTRRAWGSQALPYAE